jgi:N-sulfoglucosamine sulfohydrolase
MYYPMRAVRSGQYKLIWNVAHPLPFPFASDLWNSATWQDSLRHGDDFLYGKRTNKALCQRPRFELYDLESDPHEARNLAADPQYKGKLAELKAKLKDFQQRTSDPWVLKWDRE